MVLVREISVSSLIHVSLEYYLSKMVMILIKLLALCKDILE